MRPTFTTCQKVIYVYLCFCISVFLNTFVSVYICICVFFDKSETGLYNLSESACVLL